MSGPGRGSATSPPDSHPLTPKGTKLQPSPFSLCTSPNILHLRPVQSVSKATGKGVFWGLSCLVCLLGDLGFGAKTANLLEERKRWGGGGAEQRCPRRGDWSYLLTMPFVFLFFNSF